MATAAAYIVAAFCEIAGCYAFWAVFRLGRPIGWLLAGVLALVVFAAALTRVDADLAGRAFAAYGGVYIVASLGWLWLVEGSRPDRFDLCGAALCLAGAIVVIAGPR